MDSNPKIPSAASTEYHQTEARVQEAIAWKHAHPEQSLRSIAAQFKVGKDRLHRRFNGRNSKTSRAPSNRKLTETQDQVLCWHIEQLHRLGVPLRTGVVKQAAESLLQVLHHGEGERAVVGEHWTRRWIRTHPQLMFILEPRRAGEPGVGRNVGRVGSEAVGGAVEGVLHGRGNVQNAEETSRSNTQLHGSTKLNETENGTVIAGTRETRSNADIDPQLLHLLDNPPFKE